MDETAPLLHHNASINHCTDNNDEHQNRPCSSSSSQCNVLLSNTSCQTYWYRWYICLVFAFLGMFQGAIWNTWGPLNESAKAAFGFSSGEIELLTNWGPIMFITTMPFFMWLLNNKGLRISALFTAFLVALGAALRCLPLDLSVLRYFIHAGQILNGMCGCIVLAAPSFLSNLWFPPNERVTATGIATLIAFMGPGVIYTAGLIVDVPSNSSISDTAQCLHVDSYHNDTCSEIIHIREQIKDVLYVEFGLVMLVFISMLIFFPNRPPKPPSITAALPRIDLKAGLLELRGNKQFWIVAIFLSLVIGTWSAFTGIMPIVLKPLNITQSEAGLLGLVMSVAGSVTGMLVGWVGCFWLHCMFTTHCTNSQTLHGALSTGVGVRHACCYTITAMKNGFTDRLKGKMKLMLTILLSFALLDFGFFLIISNEWIKVAPFLPTKAEIWVVLILWGVAMSASLPLVVEMVADAGYPVCEGTSTSIVTWMFNVVGFVLIFVLGFLSNPLDSNYIIFAPLVITVPAIIFFTDGENKRLKLDTDSPYKDLLHPNTDYGSINPNYREIDDRDIRTDTV